MPTCARPFDFYGSDTGTARGWHVALAESRRVIKRGWVMPPRKKHKRTINPSGGYKASPVTAYSFWTGAHGWTGDVCVSPPLLWGGGCPFLYDTRLDEGNNHSQNEDEARALPP